jgi:hypothetical protein
LEKKYCFTVDHTSLQTFLHVDLVPNHSLD